MIHNKHKIKVILVIEHYLLRLGIKALIHHLGIEPEYIEKESINEIKTGQYTPNLFLIIDHHLIEKSRMQNAKDPLHQFKGETLILGEFDQSNTPRYQHIAINESEVEILKKIQHFFDTVQDEENNSGNGVLSAREIDILKEVALGYPNKEIADHLFISINTVITHRKNITEKLGIKTIPGLTVYALMNKLIDPNKVT
jgi:DNA-binding CsgD family transcriptional regulator